jgi:hypothetical protein
MSEKTRSFELYDADMYALELASKAVGKIMGANGTMRLLSAEIKSEAPVNGWRIDLPHCEQTKKIIILAKLRNPLGIEPFSVLIEVGLRRLKDDEKDKWPPWKREFVDVRKKKGELIESFSSSQKEE